MIPEYISPDTKSAAEKKIYRWFKEAPGTEDWIVLHSLGIARHETVLEGEVDFLVLAPGRGIFALEVKGGGVRRENGIWIFEDRYGNINQKARGPFDQAKEGVHSIMESLGAKVDHAHENIKKLLYGYGVMFPDIEYDSIGVDEARYQIFDCRDGKDVKSFIFRLANGVKENWERIYGKLQPEKIPKKADVEYVAKILRGNFDKAVAMVAKINNAENELIELTQQQYRCLDQLEDNPRAIVYGAAGTGKTLLAFEKAKKLAGSGKRIAVFCYNTNLGNWFEAYFNNLSTTERPAYVGTFHKYLYATVKKSGRAISIPEHEEEKQLFYNNALPEIALEVLIDKPAEFDEIIIDEAQDLVRDIYLDIFDLILKRGVERGHWTMFGDFTKQAIYSDNLSGQELINIVEDRTSFIRFKLTINCRNTKQICDEIETVTGFKSPDDIWNKVDGIPVNYISCSSDEEACSKLEGVLSGLRSNHIPNDKITILSPRRKENSIVGLLQNSTIRDYSISCKKSVTFCTIQGFKGLENSVIILTDIDNYGSSQLMYVALSRARTALYIIETDKARKEYLNLARRRFING